MYIVGKATSKPIPDSTKTGHKFPSILKVYHKSSNSIEAIEKQSIKQV